MNMEWNGTVAPGGRGPGAQLLSNDLALILESLLFVADFVFSVLGVCTNSINIRVFVEQGIRSNSTTLGLFLLSIFDWLSCAFAIGPCFVPLVKALGQTRKYYVCTTYMTVITYPYIVFYYCSIWTTVYLSLERSVCIALPFNVKQMFTPKTTLVVTSCMVTFFVSTQLIYCSNIYIGWLWHPGLNASIPVVLETSFAEVYLYYISLFNNMGLSSVAMAVIAVSTLVMIIKLKAHQRMRKEMTSGASAGVVVTSGVDEDKEKEKAGGAAKVMSSKEVELVTCVVTVTCIYMVCVTVSYIPAAAILALPGVSFSGPNVNLFRVSYLARIVFGLINSSINYFFYIRLSSRYQQAFARAFPRC